MEVGKARVVSFLYTEKKERNKSSGGGDQAGIIF